MRIDAVFLMAKLLYFRGSDAIVGRTNLTWFRLLPELYFPARSQPAACRQFDMRR